MFTSQSIGLLTMILAWSKHGEIMRGSHGIGSECHCLSKLSSLKNIIPVGRYDVDVYNVV